MLHVLFIIQGDPGHKDARSRGRLQNLDILTNRAEKCETNKHYKQKGHIWYSGDPSIDCLSSSYCSIINACRTGMVRAQCTGIRVVGGQRRVLPTKFLGTLCKSISTLVRLPFTSPSL